jgi:uncharacterized protein (UPF0264 family)
MIDALIRRRPAFLASVTSAEEASLALAGAADLIDCKDPSAGALGALPSAVVRDVAAEVGGRLPVSATVGDLPPEPGVLVEAVSAMAATGVDIVKIGFFGSDDARPAITALGRMTLGRARLVAVLMADQAPDFDLIAHLAANGFAGVMLDTANKSSGRLTTVIPVSGLARFLLTARKSGLMSGLAGSLRMDDIATLASLAPDVLGFRGALCETGRASKLDPARVAAIRCEIDRVQTIEMARERTVA